MSLLRLAVGLCLGLACLLLGGCKRSGESSPAAGGGLKVTSTAFENGQRIPAKYTGDGEDISPPLSWSGLPAGTKNIAVICDDPDAPRGTFVHWVLYGLPAKEQGLPEGVPRTETLSNGAVHGTNDFGRYGYIGPSPPQGDPPHHYHFRVYALSAPLGLQPGATRAEVDIAMKGKILAQGELIGTYGR